MRALIGAVAVLGLAGLAGPAAGQEKIDAKKLIGKWQPAEAAKGADVTVEFAEKGKLIFTIDVGGKTEKIEGTYKLDGDKLEMVMVVGKDKDGKDKEQRETVTLTKLTDEELVGKDSKGKEEKLKRVKGK
jgi:uncharacterized protein (TIGR03066 family)